MNYTLHLGDCIEAMRTMPDNSIDSIVTDPPYGLSFMGKRWDYDVPSVDTWAECLRVLKPGGHLLAFAGTRTQHRMAVRIEDAGFEIRDMIAWVYGSGFPKSMDVSKAISGKNDDSLFDDQGNPLWCEQCGEAHGTVDMEHALFCRGCAAADWEGWGTALKPALEPVTVARKPLIGTVAANVLQYGAGGLNIDGGRIAGQVQGPGTTPRSSVDGQRGSMAGAIDRVKYDGSKGRWPANLIHDGSPEVVALFPITTSGGGPKPGTPRTKANTYGDPTVSESHAYGSTTGNASRFFYAAKASKRDRDEGLAHMPTVTADPYAQHRGRRMENNDIRIDGKPPAQGKNHHPTVKPTDLMAYLCRLITPPGGIVLDPFMGSGSTGKAAMREGFRFIGCELDPEYLAIAKARIEHELARVTALRETPTDQQLSLFSQS